MRYRARPDGWFDAGTFCTLEADCGPGGWIMSGLRDGLPDEELCNPDEFELVPEEPV